MVQPEEVLPTVLMDTIGPGKVLTKGNSGILLARISTFRIGEPGEQCSVLCKMHGCKFLRPSQIPSSYKIERWVVEGLNFPRGVEGQQAHKARFPDRPPAS